jgi:zinc transport system permease protein
MGVGVLSAVSGLAGSFEYDLPPGPSIVLLALAMFLAAVVGGTVLRRRRTISAAARAGVEAEPEVVGG